MSALPPALAAIAEREMPGVCNPGFSGRGLIDPYCRHDDRDDAIAAAVASERERIAQLAEQHDAWAKRWHAEPHANEWTEVPFADIIRNHTEGDPHD